ncbi:MAG: LEA type 2 family protein [Thermodesulfobacteriota bacterium]
MKKCGIVKTTTALFLAAVLVAFLCGPAAAAEMQKPQVNLEQFEVPQYDGFWYYDKSIAPKVGDPDDRGAPLPMSFLFSIKNPNDFPVRLDSLKFTVAFDDFDLVTVNSQDMIWIPGKKSSNVRVNTLITVRSALLNLMVTGGFKLQAKGWKPFEALQRWWEGAPSYSIPMEVREGAAVFSDGSAKSDVIPFKFTISQ